MRAENPSLIDLNNYGSWFLSYIDGELDEPARQAVLDFVRRHPDKNIELQRLQRTVNIPDRSVVFPDKTVLYRREKTGKTAWMPFVRIAAAALVLGAIGLIFFHPFRNSSTGVSPLAAGKTSSTSDRTVSTPGSASVPSSPATGTDTPASLADATPSTQEPVRVPADGTATTAEPSAK